MLWALSGLLPRLCVQAAPVQTLLQSCQSMQAAQKRADVQRAAMMPASLHVIVVAFCCQLHGYRRQGMNASDGWSWALQARHIGQAVSAAGGGGRLACMPRSQVTGVFFLCHSGTLLGVRLIVCITYVSHFL